MTTQDSISELKSHVYGLANSKQADQYTKTTKAIAEYVGRVYGPEMKVLVSLGKESVPKEPEFPKDSTDEKAKAIWSKKYDLYAKKSDKYVEYKAKTFTVVFGQCDEPMKNHLESHDDYEEAVEKYDVVALLRIIKDAAYDANDRKYPSLQAAKALKNLMMCRQGEKETLLAYYTRFISQVEIVERAYGPIAPEEVAKKDKRYAKNKDDVVQAKRDEMLAVLFMEGASKQICGYMLKKLQDDYSLGDDKYPVNVQQALQVLQLNSKKLKKTDDGERPALAFAQTGPLCWKCGKRGHKRKDCPEQQAQTDASNTQVGSSEERLPWYG